MTTNIKQLEVPRESIDALYRRDTPRPSDEDYIRRIAAPVVIAKLYELAARLENLFPEGHPLLGAACRAAAEVEADAIDLEGGLL